MNEGIFVMMMTRFTISIAILAILLSITIADDPCRYSSTRGVIDLTTLGRTDGKAAFPDRKPPTGSSYKYSYNPCKPFSEGFACINVAACQVSDDGIFAFTLGMHETAMWNPGGLGGNPSVRYTAPNDKVVEVTLECLRGEGEIFEALGEDPINTYKFRLIHKCACWDGCGGGPAPQTTTKSGGGGGGGDGGGGGTSGGTVFIIIFFVLIAVYFVGFALFYRFQQQKSGADLIAHRTFWFSLPGYAKDGVVYTYRRIANKGADPYGSV